MRLVSSCAFALAIGATALVAGRQRRAPEQPVFDTRMAPGLTVVGRRFKDLNKNARLDPDLLDVLTGVHAPTGKLPFDPPSSMDAIRAQ